MKFDKHHGSFEPEITNNIPGKEEYNLARKMTLIMRDFSAGYKSEGPTKIGGDPFIYQVLYPMQASLVSMSFEKQPHALDTAATNGIETFWNPYFCLGLSLIGLRLVMTHETLHIIYLHPKRCGSRHPSLWNIAVDYCVNGFIVDDLDKRLMSGENTNMFSIGFTGLEIFEKEKGAYIKSADFIKWIEDPFKNSKMKLDAEKIFKTYVDKDTTKVEEDRAKFNSLQSVKEKIEFVKEQHKDGFFYCDKFSETVKPEVLYNDFVKTMHVCPKCKGLGLYKIPSNIKKDLKELKIKNFPENDFNYVSLKIKYALNYAKSLSIVPQIERELSETPTVDELSLFLDDLISFIEKSEPSSIVRKVTELSFHKLWASYDNLMSTTRVPSSDDDDCDECFKGEWVVSKILAMIDGVIKYVYDFIAPDYIDLFFFNQKGGSGGHLPSEAEEQEIAKRLSDAAEAAAKAGNAPAGLLDDLALLTESRVRWQDHIRLSYNSKKEGKTKNNWNAFKNRPMFAGLLVPKKIDPCVNIGVCIDSSMSMTAEDIAYGVSQLQNIYSLRNGFVTFADADVYWDGTVSLSKFDKDSLSSLKIEGRGGTDFVEKYISEYRKELGVDLDIIIFITDGEFFTPPEILRDLKVKPQVFWLVTKEYGFDAPFGKAFHIYNEILS